MTKPPTGELPIVQKTYDLIKWYVPILNRLSRDHKFGLGDRMVAVLVKETLNVSKSEVVGGRQEAVEFCSPLLCSYTLIGTGNKAAAGRFLEQQS